jgi:23S rRNA U2552 (ribose-2'-O)-methylase RlmE/FtsJ
VPKAFCDARVRACQGDALAMTQERLLGLLPGPKHKGYHAVLSDMCHSTLGYAVADVARSLHLAWAAADIALGLQEEALPWDPGKMHFSSTPRCMQPGA